MKIRKYFWKVLLVELGIFCLTACGAAELEERCFPLMAAVGYEDYQVSYALGFPRVGSSGEEEPQINEIEVPLVLKGDFKASKEEYESHLNKVADYNHLKVLVLEDDLLEEEKDYNEMLEILAETEEFPRNTYVCAVEDLEALLEMDKNLPQELGTYLEEYLNNQETSVEEIVTLGDLIDQKENQLMELSIPYLFTEENYVKWGGYYRLQ